LKYLSIPNWLVVGPLLLAFGMQAGVAAPAAAPSMTVTVVQPARSSLPLRIAAGGNIAAWQELVIGAQTQGGRVDQVTVNAGDTVRKGQVLLQFGTDVARADLEQVNAAVAEAAAALAEASANLQRTRDLEAQGFVSTAQVAQQQTAQRTAQARLDAQRAAARAQQSRLRQTEVRAPDDGVITSRTASIGAVMGAGQELFRMIRSGRIEWRAEVSSADLPRMAPGQVARITLAGGQVVQGSVRLVAPTVDPATRNGLVHVDIPAPGPAKPGMFARGEFDLGSASALTLPQGAVVLRDGFSYVFVIGNDARVRQAKVAVGRRIGDRVEITSGVNLGERVALAGAGFLGDGDLVRVVEPGTPAARPQP